MNFFIIFWLAVLALLSAICYFAYSYGFDDNSGLIMFFGVAIGLLIAK